jgi:hypothetical protein
MRRKQTDLGRKILGSRQINMERYRVGPFYKEAGKLMWKETDWDYGEGNIQINSEHAG